MSQTGEDSTAPTRQARPRATGVKQQAAEETIKAMLEAGRDLFVEGLRRTATGGLLGDIKATEVARRTGKTTGSFFHWWPTQEAYREELLEYLLSQDRMRELNVEGTVGAITEAVEARGALELADVVRAGAVANFAELAHGPDFDVQLRLTVARDDDPRIAQQLNVFYQAVLDAFVPVYRDLLPTFGLRMRGSLTIEQYSVILTALAEGLHMRRLVHPEAVPETMEPPPGAPPPPEGRDDPWNLFAVAVYLLTEAMTEPDPEASGGSEPAADAAR